LHAACNKCANVFTQRLYILALQMMPVGKCGKRAVVTTLGTKRNVHIHTVETSRFIHQQLRSGWHKQQIKFGKFCANVVHRNIQHDRNRSGVMRANRNYFAIEVLTLHLDHAQ
jgi:hypothetical protein